MKGGNSVKNQSNVKIEYDFLKPLRERQDIEPNPIFIQSLRKKLTKLNKDLYSNTLSIKKIRLILVSFLTILTLSVLYLSSNFNINRNEGTLIGDSIKETHTYNINELLANHQYYGSMYEKVLENTESEKAASAFVLYLEALKQEDLARIKKYSFLNHDFELQPLVNHYKEVKYETIVIEKIIPSQAEPSYEVQFSYQLVNETSRELRTMYINLYDGVNIDIYENSEQ